MELVESHKQIHPPVKTEGLLGLKTHKEHYENILEFLIQLQVLTSGELT